MIYIMFSVCVFVFLTDFSVFSEQIIVKIQLNVFGNICQIFDITKLEKRKNPSYPAVKCKSQGVLIQFWIFIFLSFQ